MNPKGYRIEFKLLSKMPGQLSSVPILILDIHLLTDRRISFLSSLNHSIPTHHHYPFTSYPSSPQNGCLSQLHAISVLSLCIFHIPVHTSPHFWNLFCLNPKCSLCICAYFLDNFAFPTDYEFSKRTLGFYMSQYPHCLAAPLPFRNENSALWPEEIYDLSSSSDIAGDNKLPECTTCRLLLILEFWISVIPPVAHWKHSEDKVLIHREEWMSTTTRAPQHLLKKRHWRFVHHIPVTSNGVVTIKEDC